MATKRAVTKKPNKEITETPQKEYLLWLKFNDTEYKVETDNIADALLSLKPAHLKTRVLLKIQNGKKVCDKILSGMQAKQVFRNKLAMQVFLNRIIFK